jgi:hypothetical protein
LSDDQIPEHLDSSGDADVESLAATPATTAAAAAADRTDDDGVVPIVGVDLEDAGAFAATLAARARGSDKEIMLLAVGDTRDHRRVHKAGAYTHPLLSST